MGHLEVARFLFEHGADVDAKNSHGDTVLQAIYEIIRLLLDFGAGVNVRRSSGWTPLHVAPSNGHEQVERVTMPGGVRACIQ